MSKARGFLGRFGKTMLQVKRLTVSLLLVLGLMAASTSMAQRQGGLVNVNISQIEVETGDILSGNNISVALGAALNLAAAICDVNVLAAQFRDGDATCQAAAEGAEATVVTIQRSTGSQR
jgi:hypothetical protein